MREPGRPEPMYVTGTARWRPPVRRHRRGVGVLAHLGAGVLFLAAVTAGGALTAFKPDVDRRERPFVSTGSAGEPVATGDFELTVTGVRTAAVLAGKPGRQHDTDGVWVLVAVRVQARNETLRLHTAVLRDGAGRTYSATGRIDQELLDRVFQPGVPVAGEIIFEVPVAVATGLSLRVARSGTDLRLQGVAEIQLPTDDKLVAEGLADTEPVEVAEPAVVATLGAAP